DTFFIIASQFTCAVLTNTTLLDYQARPTGTVPTIFLGTPTSGAIGSNVLLTGANFVGASVSINGVTQTLVGGATANRITFTVAAGTTNGRIRVTNASGSDSTDFIFVVNAPGSPTITNFTPFTGLPGTAVRINGTNLTSPTAVLFNGVPATITGSTATTIDVLVPGGAGVGPITVTTATGSVTTINNFLYQFITPTIASFTPTSGTVGTSVRVRGANLGGLTAVTFNGVAATSITNRSDTAFTVAVPVSATTGAISVVTPGGTALSGAPFTVIVNTPTITSFTPASGIVGSQVTITGTNLTGATVFFGGIQATNIVSNSGTSIVVVVPVNAQNGPITV
ncbi:MAG: IPT/TIG domain-containing protein, partial [Dolichospermum sp.]